MDLITCSFQRSVEKFTCDSINDILGVKSASESNISENIEDQK